MTNSQYNNPTTDDRWLHRDAWRALAFVFLTVFLVAMTIAQTAGAEDNYPHDRCRIVCEISPKPFWHIDRPARVNADCSFDRAGDDWSLHLAGDATVDLGGGCTSQKWTESGCLGAGEKMVVVDCNATTAIVFDGTCGSPEQVLELAVGQSAHSTPSVALLFPPYGILELSPKTPLEKIADAAKDAVYRFHEGFPRQSTKRRNQLDPFCGCKLFYPDSKGAKL